MLARACAEHDRGIDDVVGAASTAELSSSACTVVVERLDLQAATPEQPHELHLSASISPYLTDHSGRHHDLALVLARSPQQRDHAPVISLDCNQGARVES